MWSTRIEELAHGRLVNVDFENRPVRFSEVLRRWQDDLAFRSFFIALLADAPFADVSLADTPLGDVMDKLSPRTTSGAHIVSRRALVENSTPRSRKIPATDLDDL